MPADALDLLFRRLVLSAQKADALARPVEVSEILDTLAPYRAARRDGLLDTNDDYLHCLMQLLAGERGYLFADDLMQDDLKSELTAINPDLGVLTTYRTAKVRISSTAAQAVLADDTGMDLRPPTPIGTRGVSPTGTAAAAATPAAAPQRPSAPAVAAVATPVAAPAPPPAISPLAQPAVPAPDTPPLREHLAPTRAEPAAASCPYCSQSLPTDRSLKYCPHCGLNLRIRRCPGCSAEMEAEWKFCVTCGRSAS